jgi:enolase
MILSLSRSDNETEDNWLSDLSVAYGVDLLKLGIMGVGNTSKYNRLFEIWNETASPTMPRMYR